MLPLGSRIRPRPSKALADLACPAAPPPFLTLFLSPGHKKLAAAFIPPALFLLPGTFSPSLLFKMPPHL